MKIILVVPKRFIRVICKKLHLIESIQINITEDEIKNLQNGDIKQFTINK